MQKWIIMLAGVAAISSYSPTPSLAQGIAVEVPGVGVRIGEPLAAVIACSARSGASAKCAAARTAAPSR